MLEVELGGVDSPLDFVVAGGVNDTNGDVSAVVEDAEVSADVFGLLHFWEDGDRLIGESSSFVWFWGLFILGDTVFRNGYFEWL